MKIRNPKGALLYRSRRYVRPAELFVPGGRVFSFLETLDASHHQWPAAPAPLARLPLHDLPLASA